MYVSPPHTPSLCPASFMLVCSLFYLNNPSGVWLPVVRLPGIAPLACRYFLSEEFLLITIHPIIRGVSRGRLGPCI